jgi:hypothetical protein
MWETRAWYPVCLVAEAMWDADQKPEELLARLDACGQAVSALPGKR